MGTLKAKVMESDTTDMKESYRINLPPASPQNNKPVINKTAGIAACRFIFRSSGS